MTYHLTVMRGPLDPTEGSPLGARQYWEMSAAADERPTDWPDHYMRMAMRFDTGAENRKPSSRRALRVPALQDSVPDGGDRRPGHAHDQVKTAITTDGENVLGRGIHHLQPGPS